MRYLNSGNGEATRDDNNRRRPFRRQLLPAASHQVSITLS
jgi:hypothetical protein